MSGGRQSDPVRHLIRCAPPRPLEGIEADLRSAEEDNLRVLREVTA